MHVICSCGLKGALEASQAGTFSFGPEREWKASSGGLPCVPPAVQACAEGVVDGSL